MRSSVRLAIGAAALGAAVFGPSAPAFAATVCDPYSEICGETDDETGGDTDGGTTDDGALPFTGAEVVLMSLLGGGAVAGGTVLVVASRRRQGPAVV